MAEPKKLRILCLHGYNNNEPIMKFQMQNFIQTYSSIAEFTFLDGPLNAEEKPLKFFVRKGIKPPYKSWARIVTQPYKTLPDGKVEVAINKVKTNYEGIRESVHYILEHLNSQAEPYDGIAGFSQGFFLAKIVYKIGMHFSKQVKLRHPMPKFMIDFSAANWSFLTFEFDRGIFISGDTFLPGVASLHFRSKTDELYQQLTSGRCFESPQVIEFDGGHRPPKILSDEAIKQTTDFLVFYYSQKNGSAAKETIQTLYESLA